MIYSLVQIFYSLVDLLSVVLFIIENEVYEAPVITVELSISLFI